MKEVSIIIPCYCNSDLTRGCLESIKRCTKMPYEIILIDDGSPDEGKTVEVLNNFNPGMPKIIVRNEVNSGGVSKVWNQGIKLATKEYLLIMNNDTVVTDNWLSGLLNAFDCDPNIAIACPSFASHNPCGAHWLMGDVPYSTETFSELVKKRSVGHEGEWGNWVQGSCFLFNRKLLAEIGMFDEGFGVGGFEEVDWFQRVHQAGYIFGTRQDIWLYHFKDRGMSEPSLHQLVDREKAADRDHKYFLLKEDIRARYKEYVSDDIVKKIAREEKNASIQ